MKKIIFLLAFIAIALPLFGNVNAFQIAPGAKAQFSNLLDNPSMVSPPSASPLGRNWFTLETDAHVFTNQVSVSQISAVLLDLNNQINYFDGRRSKLTGNIISRTENEFIVDFVSITIVPIVNIRLNTPYRSLVRVVYNSDTQFAKNILQTPQDTEANREIKNLNGVRYAQEVTIDGQNYTYIRIYTINDLNASILPGARNTLERNAGPTILEALEALIAAAKTK
jgi:hypothetical protein